ncbi:MAG: sigma-70 family RNA polymerase sigma factor [Myxococcales bacterium]|nr:sigma-70 family RNA polymerase sigma factor [Myxococcales bacterium]
MSFTVQSASDWEALFEARLRVSTAREREAVDRLLVEAVRAEALRDSARSRALSESDRDDIAQFASFKVWRSWGQLRDAQSARAWVRRVVRNETVGLLRARGRRLEYQGAIEPLSLVEPRPEARLDARTDLRALQARAERLSPPLYVVFCRTLVGGEDPSETAKVLNISRASVDQRVRRVRQQLVAA